MVGAEVCDLGGAGEVRGLILKVNLLSGVQGDDHVGLEVDPIEAVDCFIVWEDNL